MLQESRREEFLLGQGAHQHLPTVQQDLNLHPTSSTCKLILLLFVLIYFSAFVFKQILFLLLILRSNVFVYVCTLYVIQYLQAQLFFLSSCVCRNHSYGRVIQCAGLRRPADGCIYLSAAIFCAGYHLIFMPIQTANLRIAWKRLLLRLM